jgi:hypothetical protein
MRLINQYGVFNVLGVIIISSSVVLSVVLFVLLGVGGGGGGGTYPHYVRCTLLLHLQHVLLTR